MITLMISILPTLLLFLNIETYFIFALSLFNYMSLISYVKNYNEEQFESDKIFFKL